MRIIAGRLNDVPASITGGNLITYLHTWTQDEWPDLATARRWLADRVSEDLEAGTYQLGDVIARVTREGSVTVSLEVIQDENLEPWPFESACGGDRGKVNP